MISGIVVACMAIFMVIGAADKALFNNRFGYGEEFERGLAAMGPLAMCLVGIMCAAPAVLCSRRSGQTLRSRPA